MKRSMHDTAVDEVLRNPMIIGLTGIIIAGTVNIFHNRRLIAQPDGLFFDEKGQPYLWEYKCNDNEERARQQLMIAEEALKRLDMLALKVYTYGRYNTEILG